MKILYAVASTGNGPVSRAVEVMPYLEKYGKVDLFLSGNNSQLLLPYPVAYRSQGIRTLLGINPFRILKEARELPVEKYDLVINDSESITALACRYKKVKSVSFGHRASFQSPLTPRPDKRDPVGEWILRHCGAATRYIGLHFRSYDAFIHTPVIKRSLSQTDSIIDDHVTVYLPHYKTDRVVRQLKKLKSPFVLFSREVDRSFSYENIVLHPIDPHLFTLSMMRGYGVITGAGFETPAATLWLGKKLLCIPTRDQYEQLCNATALKSFRVPILDSPEDLDHYFTGWRQGEIEHAPLVITRSTEELIEKVAHSFS